MKKRGCSAVEGLIIAFCVVTGILTIFRCFHSIDLTDESYYIADGVNAIKGALPFTHNISAQAGMVYPMIPFLAVFRLFSPDWEGVVLYMRLCSAITRLLVVYIMYRLIRRHFDRLPVLIGTAVLTGWYYFCNDLSYLTIPPFMIMTASLLVYDSIKELPSRRQTVELLIAGAISAVAVLSNPLASGCVMVLLVLIPVFSAKGTKIKKLALYCVGGAAFTGAILLVTALIGGFKRMIKGIYFLFAIGSGQMERTSVYVKQDLFYSFRWETLAILLASGLTAVIMLAVSKRKGNIKRDMIAPTAAMVGYLAGMITMICSTAGSYDLFEAESYAGFAAMCLMIFLFITDRHNAFLWIFSLPLAVFVVFYFTLSPEVGALAHTAFLAPIAVPVVVSYFSRHESFLRVAAGATTMLLAVWISVCDLLFVYRDAPLFELDTRVSEGVYKGIVTTSVRAECLPEMERWIEENTYDVEMVSFRDCVPFANLMYHRVPCDLRAWDEFEYGYEMHNDGESTIVYYALTGRIPDRYIYIDYGRDDILSVDDKDWKFNDWVYTYYYPVREEQINEMFRAVIYQYNGSFDGDFEKWRNHLK